MSSAGKLYFGDRYPRSGGRGFKALLAVVAISAAGICSGGVGAVACAAAFAVGRSING